MYFRIVLFVFVFSIFSSCSSPGEKVAPINDVIIKDSTVIINCSNSTILITENDSIAIASETNPISWIGTYNNNSVTVSFTRDIGFDNVTERLSFVFNKIDSCLQIDHGYKFYDGKLVDVSAISELEIHDFATQDWEFDKKFSGVVNYKDPHDGQIYIRKFWITLTTDDYIEEPLVFHFFSDCFSAKLPIEIDMNKDGITDFNLGYVENKNVGNIPNYSEYTIKLISTDINKNKILSPKRNASPYFVIFEPPFSSNNTRQYFNGVKDALDIFYEFDTPYQKYNYFLHNNLTYKGKLNNNLDNYFVVSLNLNGNEYFGWIKLKLNTTTCTVEILDTFLNPNPNEAISVN